MVAAAKGYRMLVVMPHGLSTERVAMSRAYGAEVLLAGDFHVNAALAKAHESRRCRATSVWSDAFAVMLVMVGGRPGRRGRRRRWRRR